MKETSLSGKALKKPFCGSHKTTPVTNKGQISKQETRCRAKVKKA